MRVPPLSLVGMDRLPGLPLPFSPDLLWRYNPGLGPPHTGPPQSPSAIAAAMSRISLPSPLSTQLPFAYDIKHTIPISLASDPRLWTREDVLIFLNWCEREFDLPAFDHSKFQLNGKALCLLTKADLELRTSCSGDVIHNALQLLMSSLSSDSPLTPHTPSSMRMLQYTHKGHPWLADLQHYAASQQNGTTSVTLSPAPSLDGAGSPQEHSNSNGNNHLSSSSSSTGSGGHHSDDSEYDSIGESPERSPVNNQSLSPPSPPPPQQIPLNSSSNNSSSNNSSNTNNNTYSSQSATPKSFPHGSTSSSKISSNNEGGEYNNNGRLLWDFLQQLLNDREQRYSSFIAWKNVETGIFKIVDPPGLARLWGIQKNHLSMNYDKMSRALRYYYRVNILRKVQGERHCYQFLRNPGELKSIKNISMLRHQNSPISLTVKCEPSFVEPESGYDDDMPTDLSMCNSDSDRRELKEEME